MQDMSALVRELTAWATQRDVRPSAKTALQLREMARQVNAEIARLRVIEAAAEEFIHTGGTWSHNELVKALEAT